MVSAWRGSPTTNLRFETQDRRVEMGFLYYRCGLPMRSSRAEQTMESLSKAIDIM